MKMPKGEGIWTNTPPETCWEVKDGAGGGRIRRVKAQRSVGDGGVPSRLDGRSKGIGVGYFSRVTTLTTVIITVGWKGKKPEASLLGCSGVTAP